MQFFKHLVYIDIVRLSFYRQESLRIKVLQIRNTGDPQHGRSATREIHNTGDPQHGRSATREIRNTVDQNNHVLIKFLI